VFFLAAAISLDQDDRYVLDRNCELKVKDVSNNLERKLPIWLVSEADSSPALLGSPQTQTSSIRYRRNEQSAAIHIVRNTEQVSFLYDDRYKAKVIHGEVEGIADLVENQQGHPKELLEHPYTVQVNCPAFTKDSDDRVDVGGIVPVAFSDNHLK
jgi:hypothetical protein